MDNETWKPVLGFESTYSISNYGRLRREVCLDRKHFKTEKIMSLKLSSKGYVRYELRNECGIKRYYAHRLVAIAFLTVVKGKPHINHIDGNKLNNHTSNLEWCTPQENNEHGVRLGLLKRGRNIKPYIRKGRSKMGSSKPIIDLNTGVFYTSKELAISRNTSRKEICRMISEERKPNTTQYRYA